MGVHKDQDVAQAVKLGQLALPTQYTFIYQSRLLGRLQKLPNMCLYTCTETHTHIYIYVYIYIYISIYLFICLFIYLLIIHTHVFKPV